MNPDPKKLPERSPRYLAFIRTKPCMKCKTPFNVQAAHQNFGNGTMGGKASDLQAVPLCYYCHRLEHDIGGKNFWGSVDVKKKCEDLKDEFDSQGGKL